MCKKCWLRFRCLRIPSSVENTFKEKMRKTLWDCADWVCYGPDCLKKRSKLDLTTFLRHVSHVKSCYKSYDPQYLDFLKKESKLKSKREWFKRNWDSKIKKERNLKKQEGGSKSNHVGLEERTTQSGKALLLLFNFVFKSHKSQIKARIEKISKMPTMDLKPKSLQGLMYGKSAQGNGTTHEEWFKVWMQEIVDERKKISADKLYDIIMHGLFKHCMDRVFCIYLKESRFNEIFSNAQDNALEKIFSELITTEFSNVNTNKLEARMTETFQNLVSMELEETSKGCNLFIDMCSLIDKMLDKKLEDFFPDLQKS